MKIFATFSANRFFFITSLPITLNQMSQIPLFNSTFRPYFMFVLFLRRYFPNYSFLFDISCHKFCTLFCCSFNSIVISHKFFFINLRLYCVLLNTIYPMTLLRPVLLAVPLITSSYPPCNLCFSKILNLKIKVHFRWQCL